MAIFWFEAGDEHKALKELEMANKLLIVKTAARVGNVDRVKDKVEQPERIRKEIELWKNVIADRPYFRDALLRLSVLNFQVYEDEEANDYFKQAEYLDPNNEEVLKVKEIISSLYQL